MGASESKLEFKEDIFRLAGEETIPVTSQWWARFLQLPETAEDVQALWSPTDLRSLTLNTPADRPLPHTHSAPKKNVETLIYRIVSRLHVLQSKRQPAETPIAPEVLNGVRILTRLLPYVYEAEHLHKWEEEFFWTPRRPASYMDSKSEEPVYLDGLEPGKPIPEERKDAEIGPPLGEQLIDILINYLFFPGFTLPPKTDANGHPQLTPTFMVWQSGIGANKGAGMSKENERNAMELLRLLLALCSRSMYMAPNVVAQNDVKPLTYLTTHSDRAIVLNTICSLLNTVLKYNQNPWNFPIGLTGGMMDSKQPMVTYSLQFLLVLITYPVPDGGTNEFRKQLSRLHRAEDFQFIVEGLRQILMQPASGVFRPVQRLTTTIPPIAPETLALFWELLQCNKRFRSYLIDTDRCRDFVVLVLYYAIEAKDDPAKQGIVRMCVFILQTLSVEEKFGRKLNVPFAFQETLPSVLQIPNFHGTYADFLIGHIHTLLTSQNRGIESLHPALLAIINNVAPYVQDLGRATSSMLLSIFAMLSSPSFLLANETNHALLFSLLDAMNAILEHQYKANRRFVEAVVKSRKRFQALRGFTVEGALAEVDRMTMERKDHASGDAAGVRSPSSRNNSLDSVRSPVSAHSTQLGNVPEHGAFAIGNDDDEEDEAESLADGISTPTSASASAVEDAVPMQSRSMSEKARGKQPIGQGSFSRSTSRNSSHSSLTALNTLQTTNTLLQSFMPTPQWLHTWLPHLPLQIILKTIQNAEQPAAASLWPAVDDSAAKHPDAAEKGAEPEAEPKEAKEVKVQGFKWTSLSLGWYVSLLWGFIYAYDAGINKGANGIWYGTYIKLFNVLSQKHDITLRSPRGAIDAVGDTIAKRVSSLSFQGSQTIKEV